MYFMAVIVAGFVEIGLNTSANFLYRYGENKLLNLQFIDHLVSLVRFTMLPWGIF
jgi:hypothetical protein